MVCERPQVLMHRGLFDLMDMNVIGEGVLVDLIPMNVIVQRGLVDLIPMVGIAGYKKLHETLCFLA